MNSLQEEDRENLLIIKCLFVLGVILSVGIMLTNSKTSSTVQTTLSNVLLAIVSGLVGYLARGKRTNSAVTTGAVDTVNVTTDKKQEEPTNGEQTADQ